MKRISFKTDVFTLIELLVVISIISLLISILLPALQKARIAARATQCISSEHQMSVAIKAYLADHKNQYPIANPDPGSSQFNSKRWESQLAMTYGMGKNIFYCPEDVGRNVTDWDTLGDRFISYGYNGLGLGYKKNNGKNPITNATQTIFSAREDLIVKPGNTLLITDSENSKYNNAGYFLVVPHKDFWGSFVPSVRHDGGNVVYIDGHAKRLTLNELISADRGGEPAVINNRDLWSPIY